MVRIPHAGGLPRLLLAATASRDRFEAVFGELHRFFTEDPDRARLLLREALDRPGALRALLKESVSPWLSAVAGYVVEGRRSGRHHPDVDAEAYVVHILQMVVTATACGAVTSSVLEGESSVRYQRELARIARSSLFTIPADAGRRPPRRRR